MAGALISPYPTPSPSMTPEPTLTPAPTYVLLLSPKQQQYGQWWIAILVVIISLIIIVTGVKTVLRQAEEKRLRIQKNLKRLRKRVVAGDDFMKEHGYSWDWVFVFKVAEADELPLPFQKKNSVRAVVSKLCEAGLQTSMFYSVQQDEVYCKVRAHPDRLKAEADRIDYSMRLDSLCLKAICERGRMDEKQWGPIHFTTGAGTTFKTELSPYQGHFAAYDKERAGADDVPFKTYEQGQFKNVDRIKLIASIIEASPRDKGCGMKLKDLTVKKACLAVFPLHDYISLTILQQKWLKLCQMPHCQPADDIKDYFGEKIGLYFVWLGHYTKWLLSASVAGFCCWVAIAALGNDPDSPSVPYFTCFMALWATFYLESWKRTEKMQACTWGEDLACGEGGGRAQGRRRMGRRCPVLPRTS